MSELANPAALLELRALGCSRAGRRLFHNLNLSLQGGNVLALTGANGSGKSTLLRCIAGFYPDYDGEIIRQNPQFQFLGHKPGINLRLSARENIRWMRDTTGSARDVQQCLQRVGIAHRADVPCHRLSAGQQRRVGLAKLVCHPTTLWLMDEPYTALDTNGQQLVDSMISDQVAAGGGVVCATHQRLNLSKMDVLDLDGGSE